MTYKFKRSALAFIGSFRNRWRGRQVFIYHHPENPAMVITYGEPIGEPGAPAIECEESRDDYRRQLIEGNWSDTE